MAIFKNFLQELKHKGINDFHYYDVPHSVCKQVNICRTCKEKYSLFLESGWWKDVRYFHKHTLQT
jgi:hypothetical protein